MKTERLEIDSTRETAASVITQSLRDLLSGRKESLRIAMQDKKGRMHTVAWELLESCMEIAGISVSETIRTQRQLNRTLVYRPGAPEGLMIAFLRQCDMPSLVRNGSIELALVGEDVLDGNNEGLRINRTGKGQSTLMLAVPKDSSMVSAQELVDRTIATSYPQTLQEYFSLKNIRPKKILRLEGKVEAATGLGIADAVCDIVETGKTLAANNLKPLAEVVRVFEVVLIRKDAEEVREAERMQRGGWVGEGYGAPEATISRGIIRIQ